MTQDHQIDTRGQLDAVARETTVRKDEDGTVHATVSLSQSYATDVEDLWEACSTADRLARWFAPVSGDLELGGRFQVQGNAGGTIQTCNPPNGFTATWEFGSATSEIVVRLTAEADDRSRLTLIHVIDGDPSHWDQYGPGAVGVGWDLALLGLATHLATGTAKPAENTAWVESDDAKAFIAGSSSRWGDAAIAAGTPEGVAREVEARTTGFYTGADHEHHSAGS